ncbi:hypothetical protein BDV97DRAFT_406849 [Delphinella strobiligena]|nr:hypothetical protein BDV97DRAFT_406849 [Delphinella strobiligena]
MSTPRRSTRIAALIKSSTLEEPPPAFVLPTTPRKPVRFPRKRVIQRREVPQDQELAPWTLTGYDDDPFVTREFLTPDRERPGSHLRRASLIPPGAASVDDECDPFVNVEFLVGPDADAKIFLVNEHLLRKHSTHFASSDPSKRQEDDGGADESSKKPKRVRIRNESAAAFAILERWLCAQQMTQELLSASNSQRDAYTHAGIDLHSARELAENRLVDDHGNRDKDIPFPLLVDLAVLAQKFGMEGLYQVVLQAFLGTVDAWVMGSSKLQEEGVLDLGLDTGEWSEI